MMTDDSDDSDGNDNIDVYDDNDNCDDSDVYDDSNDHDKLLHTSFNICSFCRLMRQLINNWKKKRNNVTSKSLLLAAATQSVQVCCPGQLQVVIQGNSQQHDNHQLIVDKFQIH